MLLSILLALTTLGCASTASYDATPGSTYIRETTKNAYSTEGDLNAPVLVYTERSVEGKATGATVKARGQEVDTRTTASIPSLQLGSTGLGSSGGDLRSNAQLIGSKFPVIEVMGGLLGFVFLALGVYQIRLGQFRNAIFAGLTGAVFLSIAIWPFLLPIALLAALIAGVAWYINSRAAHQERESNRATVEAGLKINPDFRRDVAKASTLPSDLRIFDNIRSKDNLF